MILPDRETRICLSFISRLDNPLNNVRGKLDKHLLFYFYKDSQIIAVTKGKCKSDVNLKK